MARSSLEPIQRSGGRLVMISIPCAVLLSNDLSGGIPALLRGL